MFEKIIPIPKLTQWLLTSDWIYSILLVLGNQILPKSVNTLRLGEILYVLEKLHTALEFVPEIKCCAAFGSYLGGMVCDVRRFELKVTTLHPARLVDFLFRGLPYFLQIVPGFFMIPPWIFSHMFSWVFYYYIHLNKFTAAKNSYLSILKNTLRVWKIIPKPKFTHWLFTTGWIYSVLLVVNNQILLKEFNTFRSWQISVCAWETQIKMVG